MDAIIEELRRREFMLERKVEEDLLREHEEQESETECEEEEYESESEEEVQAVFVPREERRYAIAECERLEEEERAREEIVKRRMEERKEETIRIVRDLVAREAAAAVEGQGDH